MDEDRRRFRWSASIALCGVLILIGTRLSTSYFPVSARAYGIESVASHVPFTGVWINHYVGLLAAVLIALSLAHLYIAVRPAGHLWAAPLAGLFALAQLSDAALGITTGFYVAAQKTLTAHTPGGLEAIARFDTLYVPLRVTHHTALGVASLLFVAVVLMRPTVYRRSIVLFSPGLLMAAALLFSMEVPDAVAGAVWPNACALGWAGYLLASVALGFRAPTSPV